MKFKRTTLYYFSVLTVFVLMSTNAFAQLDLPQNSQRAGVSQRVGITDININYSRPAVNEREVWGKLVPYGMNNLGFGTAKESPWRAGANENTTISFSHNVSIQGNKLEAGTYGLHMVIHEGNKVEIIFSNNSTSWGSYFYDPTEDAVKVSVQSNESEHTELLTYQFNSFDKTSTTASLLWGKKEIPFKIDVDVTNIVMNQIKNDLRGQKGFTDVNWNQAANFALNNEGDLKLALDWSENSINAPFIGVKDYSNLQTKANILEKMGNKEAAAKTMEEALPLGTVFQIHTYGRQLITNGSNEEALEIFKKNAKMHKDTWPVNYGLGRGYSALGDYKKAIKYMKKALALAPQQANKDRVQANIDKLKKGEDIN